MFTSTPIGYIIYSNKNNFGGGLNTMAVKVYSTPTCPWCTVAKKYLKDKNVPFTDYDVSKDRDAAEEMIQKSGQRGVPVLDINGEIIVGFDKQAIDRLIQKA
jgi:glutaredoxin 3